MDSIYKFFADGGFERAQKERKEQEEERKSTKHYNF